MADGTETVTNTVTSTGPRGIYWILARLPEPIRSRLIKHRELLKFAAVGGTCFVITNVVNYALKLTVLSRNPVTALSVAVIVATIVSYVLSREWSFRTRGGRERPHEAALFFLISGIGVALNALPLAVSRYVLQNQVPHVSLVSQEVADFVSGIIIGTLITTVFRWWAFKKWVFPQENARERSARSARRRATVTALPDADERAA